jgi:hypothetical protein
VDWSFLIFPQLDLAGLFREKFYIGQELRIKIPK